MTNENTTAATGSDAALQGKDRELAKRQVIIECLATKVRALSEENNELREALIKERGYV